MSDEEMEPVRETALRRKRQIAAALRADLYELEEKHGLFSDSAGIIREMRDERG